jgi:predicted RNA-binding protein YlqC (UPF0109 family)
VTELIEFLARRLVDDRDAVRVETVAGENETLLRLHVAPDDRGKVIGRNGRIVRALRTLVRAAGGRRHERIVLEIAE